MGFKLGVLVLRHCKIITPNMVIKDGYVVIEDGIIKGVGKEPFKGPTSESIDLEGQLLLPGFIDTHTHGISGLDITMNPDPSALLEMSSHYARHGVTGFLATTVSAPHDVLLKACKAFKEAKDSWRPSHGARLLGLHLEGPYISPEMPGAMNPLFIRKPSIRELEEYIEASGRNIRQITIAPEIEGIDELITYARLNNIVVSAGHTNASYEIGLDKIAMGISKATHIFNAMRGIHHREPGVALSLLQARRVFVELIADFIHLHPGVVKMIIDYASPDRVVLVTDSIAATDMPDGVYELGGLKIRVERGVCKLVGIDKLAGSTLTMDKAIRNIAELGYSLVDVVKMASLTPAKSIELDMKIGDIRPGYRADLVVLDKEFNVLKTLVDGVIVYER
ncbi:MAG: N-acetylglucosamine-6-phosphate deacetylase [Desulfurococcaceae archaeon]